MFKNRGREVSRCRLNGFLSVVYTICVASVIILLSLTGGCSDSKTDGGPAPEKVERLTFAAYTVPREAYQDWIIPAFKRHWKEKTGRTVEFLQSYNASGAQSRSITAGFEADVAALSLEGDMKRLVDAGLVNPEWNKGEYRGIVTRSLVVIVIRPKTGQKITGWEDLADSRLKLIYPSPRTSGGAMWVVNAIYGAGLKMSEKRTGQKDPAFARNLLKKIQSRVKVMDKSGRASVTTFESGYGDVLLTYENEALLRQAQGKTFPFIIPEETILIENPVAVVDKNVDKHGNREVAEAFVKFLFSEVAQRHYGRSGFRPVAEDAFRRFEKKYPVPANLFDIRYLGGWDNVMKDIYGPRGIWMEIIGQLAKER